MGLEKQKKDEAKDKESETVSYLMPSAGSEVLLKIREDFLISMKELEELEKLRQDMAKVREDIGIHWDQDRESQLAASSALEELLEKIEQMKTGTEQRIARIDEYLRGVLDSEKE